MKIIIVAVTLLSLTSYGQSLSPIQFWNHYALINPSTSAVENKQFAAVSYRTSFDNSSFYVSQLFSNYNIRIRDHHGLGVNYTYSFFRYGSEQKANLNYNYQFLLNGKRNHILSAGVGIGLFNQKQDYRDIICEFPSACTLTKKDQTVPNINVGITYVYKKLFVSLSSTNITQQRINGWETKQTIHFSSSYSFSLSENIELKPLINYSNNDSYNEFEADLMFKFKKQFITSIGYRVNDTFSWMIGWDIKKKYRLAYSFDQMYSPLLGGVPYHEFTLGFKL